MYSYNVYLFRDDTSHPFWYDFIELSNNTAYQEMKQQFITEGKLLSEEVSYGNDDTIYVRTLNFETETSSWFVHDLTTDEYCMMGVGKKVYIPDGSPLNQGTGLGVKTLYN